MGGGSSGVTQEVCSETSGSKASEYVRIILIVEAQAVIHSWRVLYRNRVHCRQGNRSHT